MNTDRQGERLRKLATSRGFTAKKLAASGGPSTATLSRMFASSDIVAEFTATTLQKFARVIGMDVPTLIDAVAPGYRETLAERARLSMREAAAGGFQIYLAPTIEDLDIILAWLKRLPSQDRDHAFATIQRTYEALRKSRK